MTIGEDINGKLNRYYTCRLWTIAPLVIAVVPAILGYTEIAVVLVGVGLAVSVFLQVRWQRTVICPKCEGELMRVLRFSVNVIKTPIKHCPFCGVNYDEDLAGQEPAQP